MMNDKPVARTSLDRKDSALIPHASRLDSAALWLRVQADAFRCDPAAYIEALVWRARGLKLRSRNRMAALAGRSDFAYRYWVASKENRSRKASTAPHANVSAIIPLIDCSNGSAGLEQTLASIPSIARTMIVGDPCNSGGAADSQLQDLAKLAGSDGLWLCPIPCGDWLAPGALEAYADAIERTAGAVPLIYADDDLYDDASRRREPHFKPDWNPELFEWHDFLSGSCIVSASAEQLEGLPGTGWVESLVRRVLGSGARPEHLRQILHHRQTRPEPVLPGDEPPSLEVTPLVSVIIPTRNRAELLSKCLEGIEDTNYPALELIVVDNESDEAATLALLEKARAAGALVIQASGGFNFSVLNNLAVEHARGELICFLNNDVEMTNPNWLSFLVKQAVRPDFGAVGARLLYPDDTIQHAGVFIGIGGGAGHGHRHQHYAARGYFERSRLPQRVSAVTAACMVVAKDKFLAVGGFDEETFAVAFNDVDLCLKLNRRGWQSFYEPRATLIHHESRSRGSDRAKANRARFAKELEELKRKWGTDRERDPFHHPNLSPFCEQFFIAI